MQHVRAMDEPEVVSSNAAVWDIIHLTNGGYLL